MHMIFGTTHTQHLATRCVDEGTNIAMQSLYMFDVNSRAGGLHMEDDV